MNVTADAITSALMHSLWQNATVGFLLWIVLVVLSTAPRTPDIWPAAARWL